ncbi:MAG: right-handed parallel beta-helix repeat-containing protein [Jiangellaceae bacterium]
MAVPTPSSLPTAAPTTPGAQRCDGAALDGPSAPPADAVAVSTAQSLADVVAAHPGPTTYWLSPGTHRIGTGQYDQVVPDAGDTFIGAPGAILDGRRENRYAFGGDASNVTIRFLTVQNFGSAGDNNNEGVVNHDSAKGWTVSSSTIQNNAGAGVMLGSGNRLIGNCLRDNGQYGFNAYSADGVTDVVLDGNEISGNNTDDWESRQPGCGCTGGGKFWATDGASVTNNYVHDNRGVGLWADSNNVGFLFQGNYVSGNDAEGVMYETSYNAAIVNNTFVRNALVKGPTNPGFPASAIYLSESGSDERVEGPYNESLRVFGNVFTDNWSGIVAWENADRFAGSPANTSTGVGTLVNPSVATEAACATESNISAKPYVDDCRWKTKNVFVEGNVFSVDPSKIPGCAPSNGCGFNGLFSNYGTYPDWSPYQGEVVEEDITFEQNNVWRNNTYTGDWHFMVKESGNTVTWDAWRSAPYHQDTGSSLN